MENINRKQISEFYDEYSTQQKKIGVNIRHRTIIKNLVKAGLDNSSNVLEIGCGIGTLTSLLVKKCGQLLAVDISPSSIEMAKKNLGKHHNLSFLVSDMSDFPATEKFDFIVLPDVLEHIPVEQHNNLFLQISKNLKPDGRVCIHIPDPYALEWIRNNKPELLQIIDQSLYTDIIIPSIYKNNLAIDKLVRYQLQATLPDYQWIELIHRPVYTNLDKKTYSNAALDEIKSRL
ncbi:MAG: class I SAM-dependent methyltransferase [Flavobacteriales bacterium]